MEMGGAAFIKREPAGNVQEHQNHTVTSGSEAQFSLSAPDGTPRIKLETGDSDEQESKGLADFSYPPPASVEGVIDALQCETCGLLCPDKDAMETHAMQHQVTYAVEECFSCDQCDLVFPQQLALQQHVRTCHMDVLAHFMRATGEKRKLMVFECDQCDRHFMSSSSYSYHRRVHAGLYHQCDECSARFRTKACLKSHKRKHTGERPYACSECDASFSIQSSFANHVNYVHKREFNYACDKCGKPFKGRFPLRRHSSKCAGLRAAKRGS